MTIGGHTQRTLRILILSASAMLPAASAPQAQQPPASTVAANIREYLDTTDPNLPAKTASLECPGVTDVVTKEFECHGSLLDGRLLLIKGKPAADGRVEITQSLVFDRAADSARDFLAPMVVPAVATLECPPETALLKPFECKGTLADRSRFTLEAERNAEHRLILGPITYFADPPSPVMRAVRAYFADGLEVASVRCPLAEKREAVTCWASFSNKAVAEVKVTWQPDGTYRAESPYPESPIFKVLRRAALVLIVIGPLLILFGVFRFVMLLMRSVVARVPFAPAQEVDLPRAGDYVLALEAPRFSNATGFNYSLHDAATGREVRLFPNVLRAQVSGLVNVRMGVRRFAIDRPGRYLLQIHLPPGRDVSRFSAVFSTSFVLAGFVAVMSIIAGVVLLGVGLIARL
jgi:hypothetical protein